MSIERNETVHYQEMVSEEDVLERINELREAIADHYSDSENELVVVGVLTGGYALMPQITQALYKAGNTDHEVGFVRASSYGDGFESSGAPEIEIIGDLNLKGKDVLIVEDIVDNGHTLGALIQDLEKHSPASVSICALVEKVDKTKMSADFVGFYSNGDLWFEGMGMDSAGKGRSRPNLVARFEDNPSID